MMFSVLQVLVVLAGVDAEIKECVQMEGMRALPPVQSGRGYPKMPAISFDDEYLAGVVEVGGKDVFLWDLKTGKLVGTFRGHTEGVNSVQISSNRKFLVTAAGRMYIPKIPPSDSTTRLWDVKSGKEIRQFPGTEFNFPYFAEANANRDRVLSCYSNNLAIMWDFNTGKELGNFEFSIPPNARFSADGQFIIGQDSDKIRIWESKSGKLLHLIEDKKSFVSARANSQGTLIVSTSTDFFVRVWDVPTGRLRCLLKGHTDYPSDIAFMPDGQRILSASKDGTVRLWSLKEGKELRSYKQGGRVSGKLVVSSDGKFFFASWRLNGKDEATNINGGTLWDVESGKDIVQSPDFVGFSPDGARFITLQSLNDLLEGRSARWWNAATGKLIRR